MAQRCVCKISEQTIGPAARRPLSAIDRYLVLLLWAPLPQYSTRVDNPCGPLWGGWDVSTVAVWSPEAISLVKAVPNAGKEWAYDV